MKIVSAIAFSILWPLTAQAAQQPPGCPALLSPQDVLDCALRNHPAVKGALAAQEQAAYLEPVALQRPNPELDARGMIGRFQGEGLSKTEASLFHTFELGGKRHSRAEKARAESRSAAADLLKAREDVALETIAALYRARQTRDEIAILDKTLASLRDIAAQLKARPRLTPEQEVSLEVFQLAESDGELRKAALEGEETALARSLELAVSTPIELAPAILPRVKEDWPELPSLPPAPDFSGARSLTARAEVDAAAAGVSAARGAAYPDMRLGPSIERDVEGPAARQTYGLNLGLALPIYQRNAAGKEYAKRGLDRADAMLVATQASLAAERQAELGRYQAATAALARTRTTDDIDLRLRRMRERLKGGLIPSSLILETYRQIFEATKSRHEAELSAIRSLWRIYAIEGRILTEKL